MKTVLITALLTTFSFAAHAEYFQANATCQFNQVQGYCYAVNNLSQNIFCKMAIYGETFTGERLVEYAQGTIVPGGNIHGEVHGINTPLKNVYGKLNCQF